MAMTSIIQDYAMSQNQPSPTETTPPSTFKNRFFGLPGLLALAVILFDQATKIIVDSMCEIGWSREIIPNLFDLVHVRNTGAAWGMFGEHTWVLGVFSLLCFTALAIWFDKLSGRNTASAIILGLLAGGIFGNMIDRLFRGSVIDFLDFHWHDHHYPAFNVADSFICVSMALLIIWTYVDERRRKKTEKAS